MLKNMKIRDKLLLTYIANAFFAGVCGIFSLTESANDGINKIGTSIAKPTGNIIWILITFVFSIVAALLMSKSISRRNNNVTSAAKQMSKGNLNVKVIDNSKDEIGELSTALSDTSSKIGFYITDLSTNLEKMANGDLQSVHIIEYEGDFIKLAESMKIIVGSLNEMLVQINHVSNQVNRGSRQVTASAESLAQGATEQASSIEELSATIMEISEQVKQNANYATHANQNVENVNSELLGSNEKMQDLVSAMRRINQSSNDIIKIIKTIEDIAFQTNILALNASVEAARAGSAGQGFSVVAEEVRNLASRSSDAAKNTAILIQNSITDVESGTKIADSAEESLLRVVNNTKEVAEQVDEIAQNSNQQADAISQITLGMDQISGVIQTNSAIAEESAAASEELSGQAQVMDSLVNKFKLKQ